MSIGIMDRILEMTIRLAEEKDYNSLLESILSDAMLLTKCDAGTLYLKEGDYLAFKIMRNNTMHSYQGGHGDKVNMPPVPIRRENVCALSMIEKRVISVEDVSDCGEYDFTGPKRYDAMTGYHTQSMLVVPMQDRNGEMTGVLQLINAMDDSGGVTAFDEERIQLVQAVASQAMVAIENMNYVLEIKELLHSFVQVMAKAIDERTPYNAAHTRNMVRYAQNFIAYLNRIHKKDRKAPAFDALEKEEFLMSVWLHDIGKLVIPLGIMNKSGRLKAGQKEAIMHRLTVIELKMQIQYLKGRIGKEEKENTDRLLTQARQIISRADSAVFQTEETAEEIRRIGAMRFVEEDGSITPWLTEEEKERLLIRKGTLNEEERKIMESHVEMTVSLLEEIQFSNDYKNVPVWASGHHELLDGSGYPKKLSGEEIPYQIRILTILDIFDALTADDRPYKPGMPVKKALKILESMADEGKLDAGLVKLFTESECWMPEKGQPV